MTVELWLGREVRDSREQRSLAEILARLVDVYGSDERLYLVAANFVCQDHPVDFLLLKPDGLIVLHVIQADGPVRGGASGPWILEDEDGSIVRIANGHNPLQKLSAALAAVRAQLLLDASKLRLQGSAGPLPDQVSAVLLLSPSCHPDSQIRFGDQSGSVAGMDELPQVAFFERRPGLNLQRSDLRNLVALWGLKQHHLSDFLPAAKADPHPRIVAGDPPFAPEPESEPEAIVPDDPCPVCLYSSPRCDVPSLRGTVLSAHAVTHGQALEGHIELLTDQGQVHLVLRPPWTNLVTPLSRVLQNLEREDQEVVLTLAAYHLQALPHGRLLAAAGSLVVLEPDWLITVSDLTQVEYCPRGYLCRRFQLWNPNPAATRGNIVHSAFEQMAKAPGNTGQLNQALKQAFFDQARQMALLNETKRTMWNRIRPHKDRLDLWLRQDPPPGKVRTETFLLAPQLGMKGRIDALWETDGGQKVIGELKTGKSQGPDPKPGHAFQVVAYGLMTIASQQQEGSVPKALLLYTGNQSLSHNLNVTRQVDLSAEVLRNVVTIRNDLLLIDLLADAPFETKNMNKCIRCSIAEECETAAVLLEHDDPRPVEVRQRFRTAAKYAPEERAWFANLTRLLSREYRQVKGDHAALWRLRPEQRSQEGRALRLTGITSEPHETDDGRYRYKLAADNQSELREEDAVLISDTHGPRQGIIAEGRISQSLEDGLVVDLPEPLGFAPRWVDKYVSEGLLSRDFAAPFLWLQKHEERRRIVTGKDLPRFDDQAAGPRFPPVVLSRPLNERQQLALERSLQMRHALLIHGPPGSGKTLLVAAIVRELLERDLRVLLAAGTNRAVDNMLKVLISQHSNQILRLGSPGRVDGAVRPYLPETLAHDDDLDTYIAQLKEVLTSKPVVGSTTTSWLNGNWEFLPRFDVAIVDEAAQLTVPSTIGSLRLADRFILIGDHKQLPAVVLSESRHTISEPEKPDSGGEPPLSQSLFEQLHARWQEDCPQAIVKLNEQYRMNEEICAIPRKLWYDQDLQPSPLVAHAQLELAKPISEQHPLHAILDPGRPVVFVDVVWPGASSSPRTNRREAHLVRDILSAYREHGLRFDGVGVIAPFRAQVATIRRVLEAAFPDDQSAIRHMVDTVDRFQGQERELIVISLATYGDFVHELLQDERRLNVALTRAKRKLIVLGDASVLRKHPTYYSLIRHCGVTKSVAPE